METKLINLTLLNLKPFASQKTLLRKNMQAADWKQIFANYRSDKDLNLEYIKNSVIKRPTTIKKWAKHLNRHFTEEDR